MVSADPPEDFRQMDTRTEAVSPGKSHGEDQGPSPDQLPGGRAVSFDRRAETALGCLIVNDGAELYISI